MFPVLFSEVRKERMLDKFYKYEFIWIYKLIKNKPIDQVSKFVIEQLLWYLKFIISLFLVHNLYMTSRKTIQNMFSSSIKTAAHKECHKGF